MEHKRHLWLLFLFLPISVCGQTKEFVIGGWFLNHPPLGSEWTFPWLGRDLTEEQWNWIHELGYTHGNYMVLEPNARYAAPTATSMDWASNRGIALEMSLAAC